MAYDEKLYSFLNKNSLQTEQSIDDEEVQQEEPTFFVSDMNATLESNRVREQNTREVCEDIGGLTEERVLNRKKRMVLAT